MGGRGAAAKKYIKLFLNFVDQEWLYWVVMKLKFLERRVIGVNSGKNQIVFIQ